MINTDKEARGGGGFPTCAVSEHAMGSDAVVTRQDIHQGNLQVAQRLK